MFAGTIGIYIASHFIRSYTLRTTAALISFVLTLWAFQVGLIPYNALLGQIVPKERYGTVSGIGTAFSWLGGVLGILFTLPFVTGKFWHISPGRDQAFLPSALAFGVFAIFSLILLPSESEKTTGKELSPSVFRNYWISASHVLKEKPVCLFLISFMLISDALLTIQNNASIYLTKAMRLSDVEVALCFLSLMVGAAIGGVFSGYLYSRIDPKRLLLGCLFLWPVLLLTVSRIESHIFFFVIFPIVGVLFGATFSICRVLFLLLAPSEERALHFGFYASFERTASIIGPAVWTGSLAIFADNGGSNYRIALLAMAGMAALAIPFMLFVRGPSPPLIVQQTIAT
jgi:UMF1 family MFS transporter